MNADDADAVDFMEFAAHLGYLGYTVTPPPDGSRWYTAAHPEKLTFGFTRWRLFLWLRCGVTLSSDEAADSLDTLEWVNDMRHSSRITNFHVDRDPSGKTFVEASAFLPFAYDREAFGVWMLQWIQETARMVAPVSKRGLYSG